MKITTWIGAAMIVALSACASSTAPGAIGVARPQLMIVPSETMNAKAAELYAVETTAARQVGRLNADEATVRRVRRVSERLIREVGAFRQDALGWAWEVNVFENSVPNAKCFPGGKIAVYTGLLNRLDLSDDELAAILGHEVAHALREHSREKASQSVLANEVVRGIAQSGSRNARPAADLARVGNLFLVELPFSREMELEADAMGLELMARAGFDPQNAPNVWRKAKERLGPERAEFLNTHPSHEHRIAAMEAALPKVTALYESSATQANSAGVKVGTGTIPTLISTPPAPHGPDAEAPRTIMVDGRPIINARNVELGAPKTPAPTGQDAPTAERISRSEKCNATSKANLIGKGPGYESFSFACTNGETLIVRCDFGNCRVLK